MLVAALTMTSADNTTKYITLNIRKARKIQGRKETILCCYTYSRLHYQC
jgi:hypothetical protein